jgi:hypothetical protein
MSEPKGRPPDPIGKGAPDPLGSAPKKTEQLGSPLNLKDSTSLPDRQASRLFARTLSAASTIAALAWGMVR